MNILKKLWTKKKEKFSYNIEGKNVYFYCEKELRNVADFFANILCREEKEHAILQNNNVIQIGWNYYKVLQNGEAFQILGFDLKNKPFENTCEDLSLALTIFHKQSMVLEKTKAAPVETSFQDTMIAHKAAIRAEHVYMQRSQPEGYDSGWYLGPVEGDASENPEDYVRFYTYQLLAFCSAGLDVLQLPVGTLAVIKNGALVEVVNEQNEKIL
ncbi:MAG: hypothetical protein IJ379_03640 [Lachnospiraceae bacterium]|nr:hypothetical protein [Lachnospiraceae bacterium]